MLYDLLQQLFQKERVTEYAHQILFESWKDVHAQFVDAGEVSEEVFDFFKKSDPSKTKKYLAWMCKQFVSDPERGSHIVDVVRLFDASVKKNLISKEDSDINKYDLDSLDQILQSVSKQKTKGEVKREQKSESIIVDETDRYLIVVPETHKASCFYGASTKWCISGKTADDWDTYWQAGSKIYIIIDKINNKKYALEVKPGGKTFCFDEQDKQIPITDVEKAIGVKFTQDKVAPITQEELSTRQQTSVLEILKKARCTKNEDGTYSTENTIFITGLHLTRFPVKFRFVGGNFFCDDNQLTSLEGAPEEVGGDFQCVGNKLTSLQGAPRKVGGLFNCGYNRLTSLQGAPQVVGESFFCDYNQLTSLQGAPQKIGNDFYCEHNRLTSLEGAPQVVGRGFYCFNNRLTSLEGAPRIVGGDFSCADNQLTSLQGAPQKIGNNFYCEHNRLTSLKGAPQEVGGHFSCAINQLTSLEGAPQKVGQGFNCNYNALTSLQGAPQAVGESFFCDYNPVSSKKLLTTISRPWIKYQR